MRIEVVQSCSAALHFSQATPLTLFSNPKQKTAPNIYNTTGVFIKVKTLRRLLACLRCCASEKYRRNMKGREVLAIIDKIWFCLICRSYVLCRVQICFKYKVFVLEQFRLYTAWSLVQCLYWNVSLISVKKTGKKIPIWILFTRNAPFIEYINF